MFVSIYKYLVYRLQRLVAGAYLDDLSNQVSQQKLRAEEAEKNSNLLLIAVDQYKVATEQQQLAYDTLLTAQANQKATIVEQGQKLYDLNAKLKDLEENPPTAWVMPVEMYKKFCAEFEQPIINGGSSDHEAAYKLGIQRVLSRIGERYVSR